MRNGPPSTLRSSSPRPDSSEERFPAPASTSVPGCGVRGVTSCRSASETKRRPPRPSSRSADFPRQSIFTELAGRSGRESAQGHPLLQGDCGWSGGHRSAFGEEPSSGALFLSSLKRHKNDLANTNGDEEAKAYPPSTAILRSIATQHVSSSWLLKCTWKSSIKRVQAR